jgi:hypothetical protein
MRDTSERSEDTEERNGSSTGRACFGLQWLGVLVALALIVGMVLPVVRFVIEKPLYNSRSREVGRLLLSLHSRCPRGIPPQNWEEAVNWTATAQCNTFFSPSHASKADLDQFGRDVEDRLRGPVGVDTIEWIWDRLAETGPTGREYVERFRPEMREWLYLTPPKKSNPPQPKASS